MEYRKVYFRIRSSYQFDSGWPNERDAAGFQAEAAACFRVLGGSCIPEAMEYPIRLRRARSTCTCTR